MRQNITEYWLNNVRIGGVDPLTGKLLVGAKHVTQGAKKCGK
jgi:hypothetical protein